MEKQNRNYAHLYIGCELIGIHPDDDTERKGYLTGIHGEYEAEIQFFNEDGVNVSEEPAYNMFDQIKLILRPLSDMTGEETLTAFHMSYEDAGYKFSEFSTVSNNDYGWMARNQNGMECFMPANSFKPDVFKYLLSIGIDLFELIPAGLAIDRSSLPGNKVK
jgi:hypothetical protein